MRDHIDELPNNIAQLSQQLHYLQDVYESKQTMVDEEVSKSKTEISQCFKTYQSDLFEAHQAAIIDVEKAKHDAKVIHPSEKLVPHGFLSLGISE